MTNYLLLLVAIDVATIAAFLAGYLIGGVADERRI